MPKGTSPARNAARLLQLPAARSRAPFAGGVVWIVVVGVLLAGIVAVNVLVLQLNMQFDGLSRERAQLKADNALLRSQLSSASASVRIEDAAKSKLGLQAADRVDDDVRPARQVKRKSSGRQANHRIRLLLTAFAFVFVVALARAAWLQAAQHDRLAAMAITQHRETIEVPAGRGTIYDRTGEPLAIGEQATTVYADPRNIVDAQRAAILAGKTLGLDADTLYPVLKDRSKGFVYVARKADPTKAAALNKREIPGLGFYPEELRTYPQGAVASHVLGFAGTDNHGLDGLERSLDKTLSGKPGFETIVKDPFGRAIDVVTSRPERAGKNVTLTIDHQIQSNAEQILAKTVTNYGARGGAAIVMDPRTGAILAMANYPTFNSNDFSTASPDARRNRAVTDAYEPGSTFKIVTIAGALEDNVVSPTSTLHAGADDPGRRPRHPRGPPARHRGDERQGHPRAVVERRHDHDRREARAG